MNPSRPMRCRSTAPAARARRGMILILVLIVIVMLSLAGYTFAELMFTERKATHLHGRERQLHATVASGAELLQLVLQQPAAVQAEVGGAYDNPELFRDCLVLGGDDQPVQCRFTTAVPIASSTVGAEPAIRYGAESDSARLNLATLLAWDRNKQGSGREALLHLGGMTEEIADAILDWIDADDEPREFGAESDYYSSLENGYEPRNAVPETIEELLLIRGVTRSLLFGTGYSGGPETSSQTSFRRQGELFGATFDASFPGWASYLTLYSAEANRTPERKPRINLNDDSLKRLYDRLIEVFDEDIVHFIIAYRQFGPYSGSASTMSAPVPLALNQPGKFKFRSLADLLGTRVRIVQSEQSEPAVLENPLGSTPGEWRNELPRLFSLVTVTDKRFIVGRVDINRAQPEVLAGVPGIDEDALQDLLAKRSARTLGEDAIGRDVSWLLTEEVVSPEEFKELEPFITGGGDVYRSQITAYFAEPGPTLTAEVVINSSGPRSRLVRWRELAHVDHATVLEQFEIDPAYNSLR